MSEEAPKKPGLKFVVEEAEFSKDVAINPADLTAAQMSQASLYAHYAGLAAKAQYQHDQLKTRLEKVEAILDGEYRQKFNDEGKKITEKSIEAAVKMDERWEKLNSLVNQAKMIAGINKGNAEAFSQRKDMVMQMGAMARQEMIGEVRTMGLSREDVLSRSKELFGKTA